MTDTEQLSKLVDGLSIATPSIAGIPVQTNGKSSNGAHNLDTERISTREQLDRITRDLSKLSGTIYEIEELRHEATGSSGLGQPSGRLETLLSTLHLQFASISEQIQALETTSDTVKLGGETRQDLEDVQREWKKISRQYTAIEDEMREDGWLVRFRTTADQADAMLEPMQKSLNECMGLLRAISSLPNSLPESGESEDQPSVQRLETLSRNHESMKLTYVPSLTRILKLMNKSMQERSTRNGEALRRLSELETRWATLSSQLQHLDGRFRIALGKSKAGEKEFLVETSSVTSSPTPHYFALPDSNVASYASSHRSSVSSSHSQSGPGLGRAKSPSRTDANRTIRRQSSNISNATVSERPRWDIGTRPPPVPVMPSMYQNPGNRRLSSYGGLRPQGLRSPSPGGSSQASYSGMSASTSRLPLRSPPPHARSEMNGPTLTRSLLAVPDESRGPSSFRTPPRPRQSVPATQPRATTPLVSQRASSYGPLITPKSEPRRTLGRNPPSSFRAQTPTPSRPSSRMSANSFAPPTATLRPFEPSKYDLLDQEVQRIIDDVGFRLFVARLDAAMKKGQRRQDDEEWKGEFVFGAGERSSSVKLLRLVGRASDGSQTRTKCMCRVAGAWHDLAAVLKDRKAKAGPDQMSP